MKRADDKHVDDVIDCVRLHLSQRDGLQLTKTGAPDREQRNRKECDALLETPEVRYAIEHTSLDSYEGQREDTARFDAVVRHVDGKFTGRLLYDLHIALPAQGIPKGCDWPSIGAQIERFVASGEGGALPLNEMRAVQLDGVPFPLLVRREAFAPGRVFLMRSAPPDVREQRIRVMHELIEKKAAKMGRYREDGWRTMLVIESDDFAPINRFDMPGEFREASTASAHGAFDDVGPDSDRAVAVVRRAAESCGYSVRRRRAVLAARSGVSLD